MSNFLDRERQRWTRRQLIKLGLAGLGISYTAIQLNSLSANSANSIKIPPLPENIDNSGFGYNPMTIIREFERGTLKEEDGKRIREFNLVAGNSTIQLNRAITYVSWNYNNRLPGPTLRATEGERVRIIFHNEDGHSHSVHFHGIHPAEMDGIKGVRRGKTTVYEFEALPYGVHPYHCHIAPVTRHIGKGLYGLLIIDPKQGRLPADEMVLAMGGYDLDDDGKNELYAFNGIPNYYRDYPIPIYQNQLVRLYLLNAIEFDPVVTFHIHANFFQVYPTGRSLKPNLESDAITMGTAERHILEFAYPYPGKYMFHPHQDYMAEYGCMGFFNVIPDNA